MITSNRVLIMNAGRVVFERETACVTEAELSARITSSYENGEVAQ